jgi:AhpC/TSA family/EF hand
MRKLRFWFALVLLAPSASAAGPPVTDPSTPSPAAEVARRWAIAGFQMSLLDYFPSEHFQSEESRMFRTVRLGIQLKPGVGWYDPSNRRHDWNWFAKRYDANRDGQVVSTEFPEGRELFARLDRDRDGAVTAEDFDWTERSPWVKQDAQALRLFRSIDADGNGKVSESESRAFFGKLSGEKGYVNPEDLRGIFAVERERGKAKQKRVSDAVWLESLLAGDLGSPFEGPRVGQEAPDFTLKSQDGKSLVALSEYREKKPVVLIFGSFT